MAKVQLRGTQADIERGTVRLSPGHVGLLMEITNGETTARIFFTAEEYESFVSEGNAHFARRARSDGYPTEAARGTRDRPDVVRGTDSNVLVGPNDERSSLLSDRAYTTQGRADHYQDWRFGSAEAPDADPAMGRKGHGVWG